MGNAGALFKLKDKLIAKGQLFDKMTDKISFDPEIESLFDGKTKEIISNLFRKKYLISLNELKKINGGGVSGFIAGIFAVGSFIAFLAGVLDGYTRPLRCN